MIATLDTGDENPPTIVSEKTVNDGVPHTVEVIADEKNVTLIVDDEPVGSIELEEAPKDFLDSPIFIGGVPEDEDTPENKTSFKGIPSTI